MLPVLLRIAPNGISRGGSCGRIRAGHPGRSGNGAGIHEEGKRWRPQRRSGYWGMTRRVFKNRGRTSTTLHRPHHRRRARRYGLGKTVSTLPRPRTWSWSRRIPSRWLSHRCAWRPAHGPTPAWRAHLSSVRRAYRRQCSPAPHCRTKAGAAATINYETAGWKRWQQLAVPPRGCDESTKVLSALRQGSGRAQAPAKVAHRYRRLCGTSLAPQPFRPGDLWGQAWFLDKGVQLGRSFDAFKARWFQSIRQ